jgi:hypothetical protein
LHHGFAVARHHDFNRRQLLFSFLSIGRSGRRIECFFASVPAEKPALRFRMPVEPCPAPNLEVTVGDGQSTVFTLLQQGENPMFLHILDPVIKLRARC